MPIQNITGLEKPLTKLVETISEAVGVIGNHIFQFDVAKIKRIGSAEIELDKEKIITNAEARNDVIEILSRAEKRFALEQYNKQVNLENILVKSKDDLEGKTVLEEKVDKDWTMRFLDIAQNISKEEIQNILAKILSGEIQRPGSYSLQTLELIKYLSQKNLNKFLEFIAISSENGIIKLQNGGEDSLKKYNLSFDDYLDMSSIGLFNQSSMLSYNINIPPKGIYKINIGNDLFLMNNEDELLDKKFNFGIFVFSNIGKEIRTLLLDIAKNEKSDEFKNDFVEEVEKKGLKIIK